MLVYNKHLLFNKHGVNIKVKMKVKIPRHMVLQGMIDKLIETGSCYGMEMNVERNKSNENFKTPIPSNNYDRPKTTGECGIF